jgi:hypothetical protein
VVDPPVYTRSAKFRPTDPIVAALVPAHGLAIHVEATLRARRARPTMARIEFFARCAALEDLAFARDTGRTEYASAAGTSLRWLFPALFSLDRRGTIGWSRRGH